MVRCENCNFIVIHATPKVVERHGGKAYIKHCCSDPVLYLAEMKG